MRRKIKTVMEQMNSEKPDDVLADLERKHGCAAPAGSASGRITAPFTMEQVKYLREWQRCKYVHPFTCCDHKTMEVSTEGFICPKCGIIQTWCHDFMAKPMPEHPLVRMQNSKLSDGGGL